MVKISLKPVSAQKPDKENDEEKVAIPQAHAKPLPASRYCVPLFILVAVTVILVITGIFSYRHLTALRHAPEDSLFHCRVVYEDSLYNPLRARQQELGENIGIYFEDNYEQISVPVPHFGGSDPADIIHDFHRGLTAYYDIALDKCYITELNTTMVMPPRNLWELLINFKRGTYLPQTYIVQEEMVVTGRVRNMMSLGPFIHRLCFGKETYRLRRRKQHQHVKKRETRKCNSIRHFENTFVVETRICDRA